MRVHSQNLIEEVSCKFDSLFCSFNHWNLIMNFNIVYLRKTRKKTEYHERRCRQASLIINGATNIWDLLSEQEVTNGDSLSNYIAPYHFCLALISKQERQLFPSKGAGSFHKQQENYLDSGKISRNFGTNFLVHAKSLACLSSLWSANTTWTVEYPFQRIYVRNLYMAVI